MGLEKKSAETASLHGYDREAENRTETRGLVL